MDRLSLLDAEFLHLEDARSQLHIAGMCVFEGPMPPVDDIRAMIGSKLHLIPRYRQRIRTVPLELGRPVWVDDAGFDLDDHVRRIALPAPGTDEDLTQLMARLMSQPLDRDRPLWEAWLVEGLSSDGWALIFKVHHCMVDGIAGVELLTVLLSVTPDAASPDRLPWTPEPNPGGISLVLDAWWGLAGDVRDRLGQLPGRLAHPTTAIRAVTETTQGFYRFLRTLTLTPSSSIDGDIDIDIGTQRTWAHAAADLDDVATIRAAFGGTINDVILASVTAGHRELLLSRGEDPAVAVIRSGIPVSVRGPEVSGVPDNRVSALLYELPVHLADPVERLHAVQEQMGTLKASHMAHAGEVLTSVGNLAPPMLVGPLSRLALRALHSRPQHVVNTVTTNVPGPQFPLYCLGSELREYRPFVPITYGIRIGTAILSYNGRLFFGVTGDHDAAPDVDVIAAATADDIATLRNRARAARRKRRRPSSRSAKPVKSP